MLHTKAPWFAVEFAGFWQIQDGPYYENTNILDEDKSPDAKANAKLAAMAPELLAALNIAKALFVAQGIKTTDRIGGEQLTAINRVLEKLI
jgi:hypothetical protein